MLINIHDNMLQKAHIFSIKNTQYFIDLLKKSYSYIIDIDVSVWLQWNAGLL